MNALRQRFGLLVFAALFGSTVAAQADIVELKTGAPIKARVLERGEAEILVNVFRTGIRRVTHGAEKIAVKGVKRIVDDPDPHRAFWRKAEELQIDGTADAWVALGREAKAKKLNGLARHAFTEALVRDAAHADATRELADKAAAIKAADPRLNGALKTKLDEYLKTDDLATRIKQADEIKKLGSPWTLTHLERAYRSSKEKKGRTDDRVLTFRSEDHAGVYTLFVPANYDPFRPTPLVVGLHGGGRGGKDGKAVVGSGTSAMNFYERGAARLGWIVVCPTALEAPWAAAPNDKFLLDVVEEIRLLFNIDQRRIYLTGHSMGGFGTWHFGPLYASKWAAISPMAGGGGGGGLQRLEETMTGVYLYHGADDNVVGVGGDRAVAERMRKADMDFVYAEIPDSGHGFPPEVEAEMWEFFKPRRLAIGEGGGDKGKFTISEEPKSSFEGAPSKDELAAFGPLGTPEAELSGAAERKRALVELKAGGGRAVKAVPLLGAMKDAETTTAIAKVLADPKSAEDVKRCACDVLGAIGRKEGAKALAVALGEADLTVVGAAGAAYGRVEAADKLKTFERALAAFIKRFDATKTAGGKMDFSDYEALLATAARWCDGFAASGDATLAPLATTLADAFYFSTVRVDASDRAGQNPATPRAKLKDALLAVCAALDVPATRSLKTKLDS